MDGNITPPPVLVFVIEIKWQLHIPKQAIIKLLTQIVQQIWNYGCTVHEFTIS